jgi:hypothetical protein
MTEIMVATPDQGKKKKLKAQAYCALLYQGNGEYC